MRKYWLSQHFLRSPKIALMLIGHSNIKRRDTVVEIGAGSGVITSALARRCQKVIAVEPDHETAEKLRKNLGRQGIVVKEYGEGAKSTDKDSSAESAKNEIMVPKTADGSNPAAVSTSVPDDLNPTATPPTPKRATVYLAETDFLKMNLPQENYKVFANPPFQLSSEIIRKLLRAENPPESFYLILQKQLALKLIITDRHYTSQLGEELTKSYQTKIKYPLKPTDFTPPPHVPTILFEAKRIAEDCNG